VRPLHATTPAPSFAPPALPSTSSRAVIAGPEASAITFARMARYPEPGWNVPRLVQHSPDGKLVTFLASEKGDEKMSLFALGSRRIVDRHAPHVGARRP
jgi:dipeptidyl-peptidase-4